MASPKTVLVVHHTVSPALAELVEAVVSGVRHLVLVTPVNIGYMSGALKHFFDTIYYPCLAATGRRPYGLVVHGSSDVVGGVRSVETIAGALDWTRVHPPVEVLGAPDRADLAAVTDLAGTVAANTLDP